MKLLVQSKTGRPRRRGPFLFDVAPTVIDVPDDRMWPEDSAEARQAGLWPPKVDDAPPRSLVDIIKEDTDQYDKFGQLTKHGGLFVREVGGDYRPDDSELAAQNTALKSDNDKLNAELESLRSQIQAREAKSAAVSTGAPERTKRQTSEDFGSSGTAPRAPARSTALGDKGGGDKA